MTGIIGQIVVLVRLQLSLKEKLFDVSNAVPSAAYLVERSFVVIPKRPGVQKKTSTFVPKM